MKQLETYMFSTVFIVSLEFLEYGYCDFGDVRTASINIDNIDATSSEIRCLIHNDYNSKLVSGFGVTV
jgi:hypothetical protein